MLSGSAEADNRIELVHAPLVVVSGAFHRPAAQVARYALPPALFRAPEISIAKQRAFAPTGRVAAILGLVYGGGGLVDVVQPVDVDAAQAEVGIRRCGIERRG